MAITLSAEQFERFITEIMSRATPVGNSNNDGNGQSKKRMLTEKGFSRVGSFSHGEAAWSDWAFDFRTAAGAQCTELKEYLLAVEKHSEVITYAKAVAFDEERAKKANLEKLSAELYEMLVMMTEGEAKLMVKACGAGDGLEAWSRLHKHYSKLTNISQCICYFSNALIIINIYY